MYAFKCGDDSNIKLKGVSKSYSKNIKFYGYERCLNNEIYQREYDNYISRSLNHEINLQKIKKSSLSIFDDKRCYINIFESTPWR